MTAEEFIAWYEEQPARSRYELLDGEPVEMQPDPPHVATIKSRLTAALRQQIVSKVLPCLPVVEAVAVKIDEATVFEPDAFVRFVRAGLETTADTAMIEDPAIVVEIVAPATKPIGLETKQARYFENPHIKHLLVVAPSERAVVHHERILDGSITATRYESGTIDMPLARVTINVGDLFED